MHSDDLKNSITCLLASLVTLVTLSGCQTSRQSAFENVKQGMEKDLVLAEVGSPNVTRRWHGKDRWIYNLASRRDGTEVKEVHFEDGKAVYVGGKVVPKVSATEQDRLNAVAEAEAQKRELEASQYRTEFVGIAASPETVGSDGKHVNQYLGKASINEKEAEATARFNESMYGIPQSPEFEKRKAAPSFEEIDSSDEKSDNNGGAR